MTLLLLGVVGDNVDEETLIGKENQMEIPFLPLAEWEEGRHALPDTAENKLVFDKPHTRIDLWLDTSGTSVNISVNTKEDCSASSPKLSADMGVHPIISEEGITEIKFFAGSDLQLEYCNYRAK